MITNNFGFLGVGSSTGPLIEQNKKGSLLANSSKLNVLNTALQKVSINTPDSLAIAVAILEQSKICFHSLDLLLSEHINTPKNLRNESFERKIQTLRQHVELEIINYIRQHIEF